MESPKIFLQPFNLSAAEDVLKWAGDDDVTCYLCWDSVKTIEEAIPHGPHPWRRSISLLDDGRSIGCVSIRPDPGDGRLVVAGQPRIRSLQRALGAGDTGIATAAVRMAVDQAFEAFPAVVRLQAVVEVENKASQKVLEKVGFEKEGLLKYGFCKGVVRDMFLYSFVRVNF